MCDVLLVCDERAMRGWFAEDILEALPHNWVHLGSAIEAEVYLQQAKPKFILVGDQILKRELQHLIHCGFGAGVVVVGNHFDAYQFQIFLDWGAEDFWLSPLCVKRVVQKLQKTRLGISIDKTERASEEKRDEMIVGTSPEMIMALRMVGLVAKTDTTVLVRGESGTGKELLAREIHRLSNRSGAFVALNCAAVSEGVAESELFGHERGAFTGAVTQRQGCFEQAHGGTLFLDEVGDASSAFQAKLLRVLEHREFTRVGGQKMIWSDVRIVAATNGHLETLIDTGSFRLDLHYRLGGVTVSLPPLRERRSDLAEIIEKMVSRLNCKLNKSVVGVSRRATEQMYGYGWPGNLRELYQVLQRAVLLCRRDIVDVEHLQGMAQIDEQNHLVHIPTLSELEGTHIAHVLDITEGNKGRACDLLGISRPTLRRKLRQYANAHRTVPA